MTEQEKQNLVTKAVKDLVAAIKDKGDAIPSQVRHALSAVNGTTTINGKPERVGVDRVLSLIRKSAPDAFDIQITITKKGPPAL